MFLKTLLNLNLTNIHSIIKRNLNCNVSSITKTHREIFTRMYPTKVILANGASINIRYHEPRKIIKVLFWINNIFLW